MWRGVLERWAGWMGVVRIRKSLSTWKTSGKCTVESVHVEVVELVTEESAVSGVKRKERVFCIEADIRHHRAERSNEQLTEPLSTSS